MADLSKLKIAVGQIEYVEGRPSLNEAAADRMIERALDASADVVVVPNSMTDPRNVRLIGLNDSRIDIAGNVVLLDARGEHYRIALGDAVGGCDFTIRCDTTPFMIDAPEKPATPFTVSVRPVGIRDCGSKVLAYDGGSAVYGPDGLRSTLLADTFEEDLAIASFNGLGPCAQPCERKTLAALVATLRRFDALALPWRPKWVIGLSGGLDSTVVASLLVLAFGADRVLAYNLATRFNTQATVGNAEATARALGIPMRSGSIENLVVSLGNTLVQYGYPPDALKGVILENAQARTRGSLLSAFAAVEGGVVVNNGNRVESALGYATMYGDMIGALAPIGDLTKVQLFDLAHDINEEFGREVVPANLLPVQTDEGYLWETMPSAELANGQRDPMKWFYHDWLIRQLQGEGGHASLDDAACSVIERYLQDKLQETEVGKWVRFYGLQDPRAFGADLDWVVRGMRAAAFKHLQAPPVITLASEATCAISPESQIAHEPSSRYFALMAELSRAR